LDAACQTFHFHHFRQKNMSNLIRSRTMDVVTEWRGHRDHHRDNHKPFKNKALSQFYEAKAARHDH
jgi:hypothetical protein